MPLRKGSALELPLRAIAVALGSLGILCSGNPARAQAKDNLSSSYTWKPVRIGVGGFVVGMTLHPLDSSVRYARTDVGNAYRWEEATQQWVAMRVANADGSGIHESEEMSAPSTYGIDSIAVDPKNPAVVYMVFPTLHSCDVGCSNSFVQIYKSTDGGRHFVPGGLHAAAVVGNPNGDHRYAGERLVVDPANSQILYYGSDKQGLLRSLDGGFSWSAYAGRSGLPADVEFINVQFVPDAGTIVSGTATFTKALYAISMQNAADAGGDVYASHDGGQTWADVSTGVVDAASGVKLAQQAAASSIASDGALYVVENPATNGAHRAFWKYADGQWRRYLLDCGPLAQPLTSVAADPTNPRRLYALGLDTGMSRSDDGGLHWLSLGAPLFSNNLGWLPQTVGMPARGWRSNGGLHFDRQGDLWVPTGQEGILFMMGAAAAQATSASPPKWTMLSKGIEEQVTQDVILPRGSGDTIIAAAEDTTGFLVRDPDTFTAVQVPLQREIIAQGTAVETAPDVPSYIAMTSSNVYSNGPNYSGYSADSGSTWQHFGPALQYSCAPAKYCDTPAGIIAVSVRSLRKLGHDHIVLMPPLNFAPQYSHDGGRTWHVSKSFPLQADGLRLDVANRTFEGFTIPELHQHLLRADPFVTDRFYLKWTHAPVSFYVSIDGGVTWTAQPDAKLPDNAFHGQLVTNGFVRNDLWFVDGWEGSSQHGVFHSSDGGASFLPVQGFAHAITIALGKGSGRASEAPYALYVYGQRGSGTAYGIFQSVDAGRTWNRLSNYPLGIYDRPVTMAASQDTFGKIILGWAGNSFAYGRYALPAADAAPELAPKPHYR